MSLDAALVLDDLRRLLLRRCRSSAFFALLSVLRGGDLRRPGCSATWSRPSTSTTSASCCSPSPCSGPTSRFSQFFLIWYGNIPEETIWYMVRLGGSWLAVSPAARGRPFRGAVLLPDAAGGQAERRDAGARSALWLLAMHFLDLYWLVMPTLHPQGLAPALARRRGASRPSAACSWPRSAGCCVSRARSSRCATRASRSRSRSRTSESRRRSRRRRRRHEHATDSRLAMTRSRACA